MTTDRVFFRMHTDGSAALDPLEREHAALLKSYGNDPATARYLTRRQPLTLAEEEGWIEKVNADRYDRVFGIFVPKEDGLLIGTIGIHSIDWIHGKGVFGIMIGSRNHRGKKYGTKATQLILELAFRSWRLHALELEVYACNLPAIHAYQKAGFVLTLDQEGGPIYRNWLLGLDGNWHDAHLMTAHAKDWLTQFPKCIAADLEP